VDINSLIGSLAFRISDTTFHMELSRRKFAWGPGVYRGNQSPVMYRRYGEWTFVNAINDHFGIANKLRDDDGRVERMMTALNKINMRDPARPLSCSIKYGTNASVYIWGCDLISVRRVREWINAFLYKGDAVNEHDLLNENVHVGNEVPVTTDSYAVIGDCLWVSLPLGSYVIEHASPEVMEELYKHNIPCALRDQTTIFVRPFIAEVTMPDHRQRLASVLSAVYAHCEHINRSNKSHRVCVVWDGFRECFNIVSNSDSLHLDVRKWLEQCMRDVERVTVRADNAAKRGRIVSKYEDFNHWLARPC
jgi:hypothetical protein